MKVKNISFVGGDMRMIYLVNLFSKENYNVKVFGFDNYKFDSCVKVCNNLSDAVIDSEIVIGPIPFSSSDEYMHTPFHSQQIRISDLIELLTSSQILIGGRFDNSLKALFEENNINAIDILSREECWARALTEIQYDDISKNKSTSKLTLSPKQYGQQLKKKKGR